MNIGLIIEGLKFIVEHRHEIAADAECAIHFMRRVEHTIVKHQTTADDILVSADSALTNLEAQAPKKDSVSLDDAPYETQKPATPLNSIQPKLSHEA